MRLRVVFASMAAVWAVTASAVSLGARQAPTTTVPRVSRSVWDGVFTAEQAKRGADVYATACLRCHGDTLAGDGKESPSLAGDFMKSREGSTVGAIFSKIRASMPQDDPGTVTDQQDADVVAYLLSFNQYLAGTTELPIDLQQLRLITIEARKQ